MSSDFFGSRIRRFLRTSIVCLVGGGLAACSTVWGFDDEPPSECSKDLDCAFGANSFPRCEAATCTVGCNTGFANCDGNDSNGCETNLQADAANCAACGRDCLGGTCSLGVCQPVVISRVAARLAGITIDATNVFYGSNGAAPGTSGITRIEKDGRNPLVVTSNQASMIDSIASDASFVYFAASNKKVPPTYDGSIFKVAKDGKSAPVTLAAGQGFSGAYNNIVTTSDFAYWTSIGNVDSATSRYAGSVVRCPLPAGCGSPTSLAGTPNAPTALAIDTTSVYFGLASPNVPQDLGVYSCPLAGCGAAAPTKIASTTQIPPAMAIAVDATSVYWVTETAVVKWNKKTMDALPMASGLKMPRWLIVDAKNVYWVSPAAVAGGGVVQSCPLEGCTTPTNVATGLMCPGYLAQEDDALYWIDGGCAATGTIMKLRK